MTGARWVFLGALLAGCVFTPRPMIPLEGDDVDPANRSADSMAPRDATAGADIGAPRRDGGPFPTDTTPPSFDAAGASDVGAVASPPDGGSSFSDAPAVDAGAPAVDAGGSLGADAAAGCDATADAGDGARCSDGAGPTDASRDAADVAADVAPDAGR